MRIKRWYIREIAKLRGKMLREKATPEYIARGWALGMFCGCLIPFGMQLIIAVPVSFLIKGSKIGAVIGTFITNHFTIFIIYPVQCYVGNRLIGGSLTFKLIEEQIMQINSFRALFALGAELASSFFIGGALLTLIMTPPTYFLVLKLVRGYRAKREAKLSLRSK